MDVITKCLIGVVTLLLIAVIMLISVVISEIKEKKNLMKEVNLAWNETEKLRTTLKGVEKMSQNEIAKIKKDYEDVLIAKDVEISNLSKIIEKKKKASEKKRAEAISQALRKRKEQQNEESTVAIEQNIDNKSSANTLLKAEAVKIKDSKPTEVEKSIINKEEKMKIDTVEQPKDNKKRKKK